jgi:hypothetical protein
VLIAKVDSLKTAMNPDVTASISNKRTGNRYSRAAMRKKMARQPTPVGPISLGGAPFTAPATTAPQSYDEDTRRGASVSRLHLIDPIAKADLPSRSSQSALKMLSDEQSAYALRASARQPSPCE